MNAPIKIYAEMTGKASGVFRVRPGHFDKWEDEYVLTESFDAMLAALRYVETRCVSDAAYKHASVEDRRMRDLVVAAIAKAEGRS